MAMNPANYLADALHEAKISALLEQYRQKGYSLYQKAISENKDFDLVLRNKKTGRVIVFEVKTLPLSKEARSQITQLKRKSDKLGYEFRLITIARPAKYSIEIEWFDTELLNYIIEDPPSKLDNKATHVRIEYVETEIKSIRITDVKAFVKATGSIDVELQYGSDSDLDKGEGLVDNDSFPFEGDFELDLAKKLILQANIIVDDSEWEG